MKEEICLWTRYPCEYNFETECGESYIPYIKSTTYPKIKDGKCPYCGKKIEYDDMQE